ncbi:MAG: elongation factor Tu [Methanoregulaceae archaeon]|nr:elongation factor Tu [Methanoregulaceae archaeon]
MPNLTVAVLGADGYSRELGKAGTASDITLFNLKKGDATVTCVEPTRYPERLSPLFFAVSMAGKAVVVVDRIDPLFGETVLMLQCAGVTSGILILRNYLTPGQVAPLIKGTPLEGYEILPDDRLQLRERLLSEASEMRDPDPASLPPGAVPVDHFFPVKGVGTVILGDVRRGVIRRHDTLRVLPTTRTAQVRSIQKHDDEAQAAFPGDRVGLSLRGIEVEDLDRGYVLTGDPAITSASTITGKANLVRYWPSPLREGMVLSIGHWMQFIPARVAYVDNAGDWKRPELTLRTEKDLVYPPGARVILHHLEGGKLRIVGTLDIT